MLKYISFIALGIASLALGLSVMKKQADVPIASELLPYDGAITVQGDYIEQGLGAAYNPTDLSTTPLSISTTTPQYNFVIQVPTSTMVGVQASSTLYMYSYKAARGGEVILEDLDGAGCTRISTLNGTVAGIAVACPNE